MSQKLLARNFIFQLICLFVFIAAISAAPGDLDTSFSFDGKATDGTGADGSDNGYTIALQPDGKIIAAGDVRYGDYVACGVTRYNSNSSLDTGFDYDGKVFILVNNAQFYCRDTAIQPDGKIIVAGSASFPGANSDFVVVRLNPNGSFDTTFDGDGKVITSIGDTYDTAQAVALQSDGKIVVAGSSNIADLANSDFALVRYNTDGSLDTTFDTDGKVTTAIGSGYDEIYDIAIQPDGKIVAVGNSQFSDKNVVVRYNTDGSLDTTFNLESPPIPAGTNELAYAVAIQPDGKIVTTGDIQEGTGDVAVCRYNPNGSLDTTFDGDGKVKAALSGSYDFGNSVVVQPDGKTVVGAYYTINASFDLGFAVLRYNPNGSLDTTFDGDGIMTLAIPNSEVGSADKVILQPDGKIIALSPNETGNFGYDFALVRLNSNGAPDTTFNSNGIAVSKVGYLPSTANAMAVQTDGKIIVAGSSLSIFELNSTNTDFSLVRYNTNGLLDTTFGIGGRALTPILSRADVINAVAIQADGKIVAVGTANNGANEDFALARFNTDGTLDNTFGSVGGIISFAIGNGDDVAKAVAIQPDGKIVVVGYARNGTEGQVDVAVARYNPNGSPDTSFDGDGKVLTSSSPNFDRANAVLLQADGKIVVVGSTATGNEDFLLIRYNPNGSLDTTFDGDGIVSTDFESFSSDAAYAAALQPDGKIIATGGFGFALARYNPNGSLDTTFDGDGKVRTTTVGPFNETAFAVSVRPNGTIIAAGPAIEISPNANDFALVRYTPNGTLDSTFSGDGITRFGFESGSNDVLKAMAFDSNGRAIVAGTSNGLFAVARVFADAVAVDAPYDFDGDGKSDISIFRPAGGQWWINQSSNNLTFAAAFGSSSDKLAPADFTGDGKSDIAFWRPSTGFWYILRSEDFSFYGFNFGAAGDIPVAADFDGDGKADQAVFRPSNNGWYIQKSSGGIESLTFGANGDSPVVADYDGDGKADIAITRINNGNREWWIRRSSDSQIFSVIFGEANDKSVQGDYTGDGKADIAFWRPSNGFWYIIRSEDYSFYGFPFGTSGDAPTPGDFDGDGKMDAAVYRQSNNGWYQLRTTQGFTAVTFGSAGDIPVHTAFIP